MLCMVGAVRRSRAFEDNYWTSDNVHESVDPVAINIESDDEDEGGDLFIDSDSE